MEYFLMKMIMFLSLAMKHAKDVIEKEIQKHIIV
jgi:hypothetical protein